MVSLAPHLAPENALAGTAGASAADVVLTEIRRAAIIYPVITLVAFFGALAFGFAHPDLIRPTTPAPAFLRSIDPAFGAECDERSDGLCPPLVTQAMTANGGVKVLPQFSSANRENGQRIR